MSISEKQRMAKKRKGLKPMVRWPAPGKPIDQWTDAELCAVAIHPMVTGLGRHPRTVSDEDWGVSCRRIVQEVGTAQFLTGFLHLLRTTVALFVGPAPEAADYPEPSEDRAVPLPKVAHPGDRTWGDAWTEDMVGGILCNPVYTGIPPYPEVVPESQWKQTARMQISQIGAQQFLVNMLYALKRSFGAPGQGNITPPFGYDVGEAED
jgi:hypothetical protein